MGEVRSVIPVEETIIDPLYEPLKLNRYELCPHLQRLKDGSHVGHGFSPYLLFDVARMREVVGVIKNGEEINNFFDYKGFIGKLKEYLEKLEELPRVTNKRRNEFYKDLKNIRAETEEIYNGIEDEYRKILNEFLDLPDKFNRENYKKIAHLFRLEYPVKVKCPLCEKAEEANSDVKPYMFMCEEGKIYSMKEALLRTFELRRARWLYMSGSLHIVHRASTHTRLSHVIGSMIVAVNALTEIDVYPYEDVSTSLGEYLLMRGELHEFLMANFLHDLGHAPLSHVLEPNPFIELDHELITRHLILGEKTEKEEGMDWYVTERYLLKMKAIKEFEFKFFENRYDPIYDVDVGKELDEDVLRDYFLEYLEKNDEILESEIITVSEVLDNFGLDTKRVVEFLTGKVFCNVTCQNNSCQKHGEKYKMLLKIEEDAKELKCKFCEKVIKEEDIERIDDIEKIWDTQFLNKLIHSEIDFDRIDHVKRDSVVCGLSLISFRLLELLGSMSVVLPKSKVHIEEIHEREENKPYIFISDDGLRYVMDLLTVRRCVFNDILYSDENNWINGVVNQITALAVRYLPHLTNMLPFITDPILMHFYTNDLFLGTQIEQLNKLFHGKMDYSLYGKPMRFKLKDGVIIREKNLEEINWIIKDINDKYEKKLELPAVVFYTNIEPTKCSACEKEDILEYVSVKICEKCGKALKKVEGNFKCENAKCENKDKEVTSKDVEVKELVQCRECEIFHLVIEKNLFELSECPICGGILKEQQQDFIECETCGRKLCKWQGEKWDDILVYGKKFEINGDEKYLKFKKLVGKYQDTSRERFPAKPSELDVKNLFYVWVNDFVVKKKDIITDIKGLIGKAMEKNFEEELFVDLDKMEVVS